MERQFVGMFSRIDQWNGSLWEYSLGLTNGTAVCGNTFSWNGSLWEYSLGLTNGTAVCGNILSD
jgi:hypothetical protein